MVFYDESGLRRLLVWGSLLVALIAGGCFLMFAYASFAKATSPGMPSYDGESRTDPRHAKTIALTFDDGPDPEYTRAMMDLLKAEDVPGTFFLIGSNVVEYPDVAREIVENGFEIGNHTFTHSEHMADSEERLKRELVATDRVIRDATGRTPILFRPPFLEDVDVGEFDGGKLESIEIRWAESQGYIVVGANLDTRDWEVTPGDSATIIGRMYENFPKDDRPTVIIMHEHAGAGATIAALREFIPEMKRRGYRFVPVSEYFGLTPADVMPSAPEEVGFFDSALVSAAKLYVRSGDFFTFFVGIISVIGLARIFIIVAIRKAYVPFVIRKRSRTNALARPPLSILIPAYNEAANIQATIRSVMAATHWRDQVIVIDDGSTDTTAAVVRKLCAQYASLVLLQKENSGTKGNALQYALPHVSHDVVVCIDADTIIAHDSLDNLAHHFDNPAVGAVAGKVYPAHTKSVLAIFQYLEYVQGQNIEKEVLQIGNAIGIVPGALGAWRVAALRDAGGYSPDTVVEDQDLTLALLTRGWRVIFEPTAKAFTETPSTLHTFFKQRVRWVFGTAQCAWKYRGWLFSRSRPSLGWIVMPNMVFFNLFIPLTIPIVDAAVIAGLFGWLNIWTVLGPFIVFTLFDVWCAFEALTYEQKPVARLLPLVVWQRFFYRYVIAAALMQSITRALLGSLVGWGEQVRRGDCHEAFESFVPALQSQPSLQPSPVTINEVMRTEITATSAS